MQTKLLAKIKIKLISIIYNTSIKYNKLYYFKIDNIYIIDSNIKIVKTNNIDDLKNIYNEREDYFKLMYQRWLSLGYLCFIMKIENNTVGLLWLNNTYIVPCEFNQKLILENKNEAGILDGYVLKEYRGQGIYKSLWNAVLTEAKKIGITTLYAQILMDNTTSFKVHYPLGLKKVYQILYYYRLLWFNFYRIKKFSPPRDISMLRKDIIFNER